MSKPHVEAGQLWMFHGHDNNKDIYLVVEPFRKLSSDGWRLFRVDGKGEPEAWDVEETMRTNSRWKFLS